MYVCVCAADVAEDIYEEEDFEDDDSSSRGKQKYFENWVVLLPMYLQITDITF